jgi:hypothetical protein
MPSNDEVRVALAPLLVLVLGLAGCGSPALKPDPEAPQLLDAPVSGPGKRFTISPPKGFVVSPIQAPISPGQPADTTVELSLVDTHAFMSTSLCVVFHKGPATDERLDQLVARIRSVPPDKELEASASVASAENVSLAGHEGRLIQYDLSVLTLKLRSVTLLVASKDGIYAVNGAALQSDWAARERSFRASLASFSIGD